MSKSSWVKTLAAARQRPDMFQGGTSDAHRYQGIHEPLRLLWELKAFAAPRRASVSVSPSQYHCRCESGPLVCEIDQLIDWDEWDILLEALSELQRQLDKVSADWARPFRSATVHVGACGTLLYLADRGVIAIRTSAGLWCQSYEKGWPTTPPSLVADSGQEVGLMVAASLNPQWCAGLPFTWEAVQEVIPEAARLFVTVEWHPEDDLLPECAPDPHCVHQSANIGRWL